MKITSRTLMDYCAIFSASEIQLDRNAMLVNKSGNKLMLIKGKTYDWLEIKKFLEG
jgi:hypothetical protein